MPIKTLTTNIFLGLYMKLRDFRYTTTHIILAQVELHL